MKRNHPKKISLILIAALLFAGLLCGALSSHAALEEGRYTALEKLGFAFHSLSGAEPDFSNWIAQNEAYLKAFPVDKQKIHKKEMERLGKGLLTYDREEDLIHIAADVRIEASAHYEESVSEEGKTTNVRFNLRDLPDGNFFPFQIGDIWVAVVIKDFETLLNITMDQPEFQEFSARIGFDRNIKVSSMLATMDLNIRPVSVDTSAPVMVEGMEMWLMLAEVVHMEVWRKVAGRKNYFWEYKAPWYMSSQEQQLRDLYWQN